jgi:hypothetical protein
MDAPAKIYCLLLAGVLFTLKDYIKSGRAALL